MTRYARRRDASHGVAARHRRTFPKPNAINPFAPSPRLVPLQYTMEWDERAQTRRKNVCLVVRGSCHATFNPYEAVGR